MITRGRYGATGPIHEAKIGTVEVLTRDDLPLLAEPRTAPPKTLSQLRDSHHMVARLIAAGVRPMSEVARRCGYTANRIWLLKQDPTFIELVEHYRKEVHEQFVESVDDFIGLATGNMMIAERQLRDKLEKADLADESLPTRDLIAISRDAADRFGYGKKSTRDLNVNVDFAAQLEKTIARSKTIEGRATDITPTSSSPTLAPAAASRQPIAPPLRRRSIA